METSNYNERGNTAKGCKDRRRIRRIWGKNDNIFNQNEYHSSLSLDQAFKRLFRYLIRKRLIIVKSIFMLAPLWIARFP